MARLYSSCKSVLCATLIFLSYNALEGCSHSQPRFIQPAEIGIPLQKWRQMSVAERELKIESYKNVRDFEVRIPAYQSAPLRITVSHGEAKFPPEFVSYPFQESSIVIQSGTCADLPLYAISEPKLSTLLHLCFNGWTVFLDPSRYDMELSRGTFASNRRPQWEDGFLFKNLHTKGYVGLEHTDLEIKTCADAKCLPEHHE